MLRDSEGPIAPGAPILEVGDPADLEAVIDVLTSQAVRVRPGAPAALEQWGGREPLEAKVAAIQPSGFTKVSALGVEEQPVAVVLAPGPGGWPALGDGFQVEGRIVVHEECDALKVPPAGALFRSPRELPHISRRGRILAAQRPPAAGLDAWPPANGGLRHARPRPSTPVHARPRPSTPVHARPRSMPCRQRP